MPARESRDVADIHQRLDSISRHIEQMSRPTPRQDMSRGEPAVARQLNDAISRLDARLAQISNPPKSGHDWQRQSETVEHAAAQVYRPSPPLSPVSLDSAIAEIAARQNELDNSTPRPVAPRSAPPIAPAMPSAALPAAAMPASAMPAVPAGPDFSSLERYLVKITSQIEAWRPDAIEQSIGAFRNELAEIRAALTEAMPRRAIESIENEIRSLSRRIDDTRQNGIDSRVLTGIEHALNEIREALRSLTPAEQLTGYDEAIHKLGAKLDTILRSNEDPSTVQQLEGAIAGLRSIVTNIASNEALGRLSDDLHTLSTKVDQLARSGGNDGSIAGLEQRIVAALTASLEGRERPVAGDNPEQFESAVRALSDRLDRMPVGNDSISAFAHLEQRVSYLLERLETSADHRGGNFSRVEEGLQDILRHLENQQASFQTLASGKRDMALPQDSGIADIVKRELSDIRFSQTERDRHTQDLLEAVHNTLGHVVDRLALIEGDLRVVRPAPVAPQSQAPAVSRPFIPEAAAPQIAMPTQPKPELPNPAAREAHFDAAPREFHSAQPHPAALAAAAAAPRAISEILEPQAAPARASVAAELPPDHPLEPGTRPSARQASPSERIAASENAISAISKAAPEPASSTNFIAAARRAAQAAAAAQATTGKANAKPAKAKAAPAIAAPTGDKPKAPKQPSTVTSKIRSLLVGASVVMIVLGSFKMAMTVLDSSSPPPPPARVKPAPSAPAASSMEQSASPPTAAPAMPSMTAPTPIDRQSYIPPASGNSAVATIPIPQAPSPTANGDVTGSIPAASPKLGMVQIPSTETLPDAIGSPVLRAAALKGDPTAAYEIGVRYAEGKGVTANLEEAAKWYDRAAQAGVVPAIFRLGTLYEKGMGVKKDTTTAQRYYLQAADRGNAKAMHNLAVLFADGGGNGSDYKTAAQWFRKAADRGVADSQFNLGILYARGIGVEQNLAESYKWFSLAAAQGDADAGHKRDDIAKQLDAQSLAAAQLAIQTFKPEPQPNDATNVATPPGGWDTAAGPATAIRPAKPIRRAAR